MNLVASIISKLHPCSRATHTYRPQRQLNMMKGRYEISFQTKKLTWNGM